MAENDRELAREVEKAKYVEAYKDPRYKMGDSRMGQAKFAVFNLVPRTSLLDVGCGRGEILDYCSSLGFQMVRGVEAVPYLAEREDVVLGDCLALPFDAGSFDHVTMFDVIEHLLPGDDKIAIEELCRVAKTSVLFTIANNPSTKKGVQLHINLKDFNVWDELIREWVGDIADVEPFKKHPRFPNALWKLHIRS